MFPRTTCIRDGFLDFEDFDDVSVLEALEDADLFEHQLGRFVAETVQVDDLDRHLNTANTRPRQRRPDGEQRKKRTRTTWT